MALTSEERREFVDIIAEAVKNSSQTPTQITPFWTMEDHNTLLQVKTLLEVVRSDISDSSKSSDLKFIEVSKRITAIEQRVFTIDEHTDIKSSVQWSKDFRAKLQAYGTIWILMGGLLGTIVNTLLYHWPFK